MPTQIVSGVKFLKLEEYALWQARLPDELQQILFPCSETFQIS
jgi:hypothetical protein